MLEHRPLPTSEKDIVSFLLAVASGVRHLHSLGLVHRDIKPTNILWRDSLPVLIDLGLVKDTSAVRGHSGDSLSIVDGKVVGVGTPRYAAPEQLSGDEVSPATDVYALGMLASECFGDSPPRRWRPIIQRATAAIRAQRYATAESFICAIRRVKVWRQLISWIGGVLCLTILAGLGVFACRPSFPSELNLEGKKVIIRKPIALETGCEYWIVGPGVLDAQFTATSTATVHVANCIFRNRTTISPGNAGVDYMLDGGAYQNFTELPDTEAMKADAERRIRNNWMSEGRRWWRIKGPDTMEEVADEDNKSSIYSATM